ncbi:MAG: DUF421 domain-containing protein [Acidobacteriota bacterium]|nr:DUF421 domain-containing protein [Acidobacteriota bacterium]
MDLLFGVDWKQLFTPDTPILESIVRGTVIYVSIFFLVRLLPNRQIGGIGMNDLLLVVLVASAATNSLTGDHKSIINGIIIVSTVILWSYVFNWLGFKFPSLQRVFQSAPKIVIKNGEIQRDVMNEELLTEEELKGKLRRHGTDDISKVQTAYIESDGQISVIKN